MALIKTKQEQHNIAEGGRILGEVLERLLALCKAGVQTAFLDQEAERLITEAGGLPSFKGFTSHGAPPYPGTICASVNEAVVHQPPIPGVMLKEGDILSIDIGMIWNGLYTDMAVTIPVGSAEKKTLELVERTRNALFKGIEQCRAGNTIADIGRAIEQYISPFHYGIVRGYVGHGVGHAVHEPPQIPNYFVAANREIVLKPGMVLALEPMISMGSGETEMLEDNWTVVTRDKSLSAHFEHTVIVTEHYPLIVTLRPHELI